MDLRSPRKRRTRLLCSLLLLLSVAAHAGVSEAVRLAWNPNPESDIAGYRVYRGQKSRSYDLVKDVGLSTKTDFTDLVPGTTYYFAVTAYNRLGAESEPSDEVSWGGASAPLPANRAPTAQPLTVRTAEDSEAAFSLLASNADGDPVDFSILTQPSHGKLLGVAPNLRYVPDPDFFGTDRFEYRVRNGRGESSPAEVSIEVTPVNDPPVAHAIELSLGGGPSIAVVLTGFDVDGDSLSFSLASHPSKGFLLGIPPLLVYVPILGAFGEDLFSFTVSDGKVASAPALVRLRLGAGNTPPVAQAGSVSVAEDSSVPITLRGSDSDGDPLSFQVVQPPAHGVLSGSPPNLTYRPAPDYFGSDSLTFTVSDGRATSSPARIQISVTPVNDDPKAQNATVTLAEDSSATVRLSASDPDGDSLTYSIIQPPGHGVLTGTAPNLTYRPEANYHGSDSFRFRVSDGKGGSATATVNLTVTPVNDPPTADAISLTATADTPRPVVLTGSDIDGDSLTFSVVENPRNGRLSGTPPNLTYRANKGFSGTDSFRYVAHDGRKESSPATVTIVVTAPENRPPVAQSGSASGNEDTRIVITLRGTDPDGDSLTYRISRPPAHGVLVGNPPRVDYYPHANYHGADSFEFTVSDGRATSSPATISLTVHPVNDPPLALAATVSARAASPTTITLRGTDPDGDTLYFTVISPPSNGILQGFPPNLVYFARPGFRGNDSFRFVVTDGRAISAPATVSIMLDPSGALPVINRLSDAQELTLAALGGGAPEDLQTFGDVEAFDLALREFVEAVELPATTNLPVAAPGTLSGIGGPLAGASRELTASSFPIAPTAAVATPDPQPDTLVVAQAGVGRILLSGEASVLANDAAEPASLQASLRRAPAHGAVELGPDGSFVYRHFGGPETGDSFTYAAISEAGESPEITVSIHIVAIQSVQPGPEGTRVDFTVASGLAYSVECADPGSGWRTLAEFTADATGVASALDPEPPSPQSRYYRVTCVGSGHSVRTETWARQGIVITSPASGPAAPFLGPVIRAGAAISIASHAVVLEGPEWTPGQFEWREGFPTHIAFIADSANPAAVGRWWPLTGNDSLVLFLDGSGDDLAALVAPGDRVEIRQLLSVADLFGNSIPDPLALPQSEWLSVEPVPPYDAGWSFMLHPGPDDAGYYAARADLEIGPVDGGTLTLLPAQAIGTREENAEAGGGVITAGRVTAAP